VKNIVCVLGFLLVQVTPAFAQTSDPGSQSNSNPATPYQSSGYSYGQPTTQNSSYSFPNSTGNTTTPQQSGNSFPTFQQPNNSGASSLLPQWSVGVGNSGNSNNYGSGNTYNGNYFGGSSNYNGGNSGGYNYPSVGNCGISGYADVAGFKTGTSSESAKADLSQDGLAGRVGLTISSQKCLNHEKFLKLQLEGEARKIQITENGQTHRRCVEAVFEATKMDKNTENLMALCKPLLESQSPSK
jgi:hypothetical protein